MPLRRWLHIPPCCPSDSLGADKNHDTTRLVAQIRWIDGLLCLVQNTSCPGASPIDRLSTCHEDYPYLSNARRGSRRCLVGESSVAECAALGKSVRCAGCT